MIAKMAILSLLLALLFHQSLQAATIRVVTENRSYYQQINADGSLGGYATEVVQALFAITGDTPQFEINSWGRSLYEAVNNDNVMIYSMSFNPKRAALFDCVAELGYEELYFWALKNTITRPILSVHDLRPFHIAVSISSNPDQYLTEQGINKLLRTATPEQALGMLFRQRVEIVIGTEKSILLRALELGYDDKQLEKVFSIPQLNNQLCAAFNNNSDPQLRQRYKQAFAVLKQNGTLAEIKQRWQVQHSH
jgi:polar amino acid transport system substrate-binding protein